jgi:hypothetical protein
MRLPQLPRPIRLRMRWIRRLKIKPLLRIERRGSLMRPKFVFQLLDHRSVLIGLQIAL